MSLYIWSHVEPGSAILCACIVTYGPLFVNLHLRIPSILSRGKPGSASRKTWSDSRARSSTNTSAIASNGAETSNGLEGRSLIDRDPLGYVEMNQSEMNDRYETASPTKRHDLERAIKHKCTAIPGDRETSWHD